jgi:glycine cleavage system H protein
MYPTDYLYSEDHEWIQVNGDTCTLGITDYAQNELGDVVFVELPDVGQTFDVGDEIGTLESVKAVAEFYTPVAGEVLAVNETLDDEPETINSDPHGDGWLVRIRSSAAPEGLMDAAAYEILIAGEKGE